MKRFMFASLFSAALMLPGMFAQNGVAPAEKEGRIQTRKENQQRRIGNGVKSGQLTPHETVKLEKKETRLNKQVRTERAQNGGHLTTQEKKQVNRQQNRISKDIYKDKHNQKTVER